MEKYAFILLWTSTKPMCLIYSESVFLVKSGNVKLHYDGIHSNLDQMYPLNTEGRKKYLSTTCNGVFTEDSLGLGKRKNNSDAEMVKECACVKLLTPCFKVNKNMTSGKNQTDPTVRFHSNEENWNMSWRFNFTSWWGHSECTMHFISCGWINR